VKKPLSPFTVFPRLSLGVYRFLIEPENGPTPIFFQGSTWRGALGHALREYTCPWEKNRCQDCREQNSCAYYVLYESGSDESGFRDLPRPYLIGTTEILGPRIFVNMTLIGNAGVFLGHVIASWVRAGQLGIGARRMKFNLRQVDQIMPNGRLRQVYAEECGTGDYQRVFPLADYLDRTFPRPPFRIIIKTPLRLKLNGQPQNGLDLPYIFRSLATRLSHLHQHFCNGYRPERDTWKALTDFFQNSGASQCNLWWADGMRYSNRQKSKIPLGGMVGELYVSPEADIPLWWNWWQAAELFHLGKGAAMGLGKIVIHNNPES
jgi:hypothetical protein